MKYANARPPPPALALPGANGRFLLRKGYLLRNVDGPIDRMP